MQVKNHHSVFLLLVLILGTIPVYAGENQVDFRLTVLHNDDAESRLIDAGPGQEDFGGVARFATLAGKLERDALSGPGVRESAA